MPDANGRFKGISVPRVPWEVVAIPASEVTPLLIATTPNSTVALPEHTACGTPDCCGKCPTASGRM